MEDNKFPPRVRVGGLWKNTTRDGKTYLSGNLGGLQMQIWPNGFKRADSKDPDFYLFFSEQKKKEEPKAASHDDFSFDAPSSEPQMETPF